MLKTRANLISQINAEIKQNGNGEITGPILNNVLINTLQSVPGHFAFPKSEDLTSLDTGKLMMNVGGFATVCETNGGLPAKGGKVTFTFTAGAEQYQEGGPGFDYLWNSIFNYSTSVASLNMSFRDIFDPGAPEGVEVDTGATHGLRRYPEDALQFAKDFFWAISAQNETSNSQLIITRTGTTVTIEGTILPQVNSTFYFNVTNMFEDRYHGEITQEPSTSADPFVEHPVLGVLAGIDGENALIENSEVIKVQLANNVVFTSDIGGRLDFDYRAGIYSRLLVPADEGKMKAIYPEDTDPDDFKADWFGGFRLRGIDKVYIPNSTFFVEALQEGTTGDFIWVRRFNIYLSQTDLSSGDYNYKFYLSEVDTYGY